MLLTDAGLNVAIWQWPRMKGIVDILATNGIDTADEKTTQILAVSPAGIISARRHFPVMALRWQTVKHCLGERPVLNIVLEQESFRLGALGLEFTQ